MAQGLPRPLPVHNYPIILGEDALGKDGDEAEPNMPHQWLELAAAGAVPSGRYGHSAVTFHRYIFIFGGFNSDEGTLNDMYRLSIDTLKWRRVRYASRDAPAPRFYHSAVVHNGAMYVFGGLQVSSAGQQDTAFNDVWRFDFRESLWAQVNTSGRNPFGRHNHVAVVYIGSTAAEERAAQQALMGGGEPVDAAALGVSGVDRGVDTSGDGIGVGSISPRDGIDGLAAIPALSAGTHPAAAAPLTPPDAAAPISKGKGPRDLDDAGMLIEADPTPSEEMALLESRLSPPLSPLSVEAELDRLDGSVGALSGLSTSATGVGGGDPDTGGEDVRSYMYLFGGYGREAHVLHRLCLSTYEWEAIAVPAADVRLRSHSVILHRGVFYAFGGRRDKTLVNTLLCLSAADPTSGWRRVANCGDVPGERFGHSCLVSGDFMYLFGGFGTHGICEDLFRFSFQKREWTLIASEPAPSRRYYHSAAMWGHDMYVFGGYSDDGFDKKRAFKNDLFRIWMDPVVVPAPSLASDLRAALTALASPEWADLEILVGGTTFNAHRVILAARSAVLRSLVAAAPVVEGVSRLTLDDMAPEIFRPLLEFLYTDTLDAALPPAVIVSLLPFALRFGLPRLHMLGTDRLRAGVTISTVAPILLVCDEAGASSLRRYCMDFILENLQLVRSQASFAELKRNPDLLLQVTEAIADKVGHVAANERAERGEPRRGPRTM